MSDSFEIRESLPGDKTSIETLYAEAFPDEDLLPVVRELLRGGPRVFSLVAMAEGALVGHVSFTYCSIVGRSDKVAMLAPLAVAPARQRQGIGKALVHAGFRKLEDAGISHVYVLGDPAYYGRFGFTPEYGVSPPYPLPKEWRDAWQSLSLGDEGPVLQGQITVPQVWRDPALWGP